MKRFLLLGMALVFAMQITIGQPVLPGYRQSSVAPELMAAPWSARWISVPGASPDAYGVYHFRKVFELANVRGTLRCMFRQTTAINFM